MNDEEPKTIIKTHPRCTYESLINTFNCIQFLIQTVSQSLHNDFRFVPITQQTYIQQRVKDIYQHIKVNELESNFITEIKQLFEKIASKHEHVYLHYYLQGYDEAMYTRQQVSLIESKSQQELFEFEMNQLVDLMFEIEDLQVHSYIIPTNPTTNKNKKT